jgi:hypothetical protein
MAKTLCVRLNAPAPELVHEFRNLGEEVWGALHDECEISLAEIDASTSEFHLRGIHKRDLRTVAARLRKLVEKSGMRSHVTVSEAVPEDEERAKRQS